MVRMVGRYRVSSSGNRALFSTTFCLRLRKKRFAYIQFEGCEILAQLVCKSNGTENTTALLSGELCDRSPRYFRVRLPPRLNPARLISLYVPLLSACFTTV